MSATNVNYVICNCCKRVVAPGCAAFRSWLGAAKKYAPKYALTSAFGIKNAAHCPDCEAAHTKRLALKRKSAHV